MWTDRRSPIAGAEALGAAAAAGSDALAQPDTVRCCPKMLRPGLYATGPGEAKFRDFRFAALED